MKQGKNAKNDFGKVAVLMGGSSAEREVSLKSGRAVLAALQRSGINAEAVDANGDFMQLLQSKNYDRAFIVLHGRGGEDGTVQGALDTMGMPYTGSGVLGSALGMDKLRCKSLWQGLGIPTADFAWVRYEDGISGLADDLRFPIFVKPANEGSSIGMSKVEDIAALKKAVELAWQYDDEVLIEQYIDGIETSAAILQDQVLPLIRIETPREFYDYEAKYQADTTQYHCPSGLAVDIEAGLQRLAQQAYSSVGCSGWGRVDFMLDQDMNPYVLEVNTVPGMTDHSLVPMAAKAAGIEFDELVLRILETSNEKRKTH